MKKKFLLAVCALTAATAMTVGFAACGEKENSSGLSAEEAAAKIATFTGSPSTVNATFKQTYKLEVNSDNQAFKAFEQEIEDVVTIQLDLTAGNLYYYGKNVAKDNSVMEQLVVKEDSTYYYLTTNAAKTALADETAAKAKIDELIKSISYRKTGYIDSSVFVYSSNWLQTYVLLGSSNVSATNDKYFTYKYTETESKGLNAEVDMQYVAFYGDSGVFDAGTDATHTGAKTVIETNDKGYITSFSETMNNHAELPLSTPPVPINLTGTRGLTATYDGTITKKAASDIDQVLTPATVVVGAVEHATVTTYDFKQGDYSTLNTPSSTVSIGNFVAVKVECETGYEVSSVTVNGGATQFISGYYCYMTPAESGQTFNVAVVVVAEGEDAPTTGTIVAPSVEHATITTYDYKYQDNSSLTTPSTTVTPGNFVAVKVVCDAGYEVKSVKVNGADTVAIAGYYCYMTAATAGTTYNVAVVVGLEGSSDSADSTVGTIVVTSVDHATITTYDYKYQDNSTLETASTTVTPGNFVAVKVICEAGYTVESVKVNGTDTVFIGGFYCLMSAATAGTTYTVVVTLTANS